MKGILSTGMLVTLAVIATADAKPRAPTFRDISRARVLGLSIDDIEVQAEGNLRLRARIEVECKSLKSVKPVDGRCFVNFPRKETTSYLLDARINKRPNPLNIVFAPGAEDEFTIRGDDLVSLELLAAGSSAGAWSLELRLVAGKPDASTANADSGAIVPTRFPGWVPAAKTFDEFAVFEADGVRRGWCAQEHYFCAVDGFDGGDFTTPDMIDIQIPTSWIDRAGKLMLSRRRPEFLKRYRDLGDKNVLAFASQWLEERARLKEFKVGDTNGDFDALAKELPQIVSAQVSKLQSLPASLDRSSSLYEQVARIKNALSTELPSDVISNLAPPLLTEIVKADVAAFVANPTFPTKADELSQWADAHDALLNDGQFPDVLVALGERLVAQKQFPALQLTSAEIEPTLIAALKRDDLRDRIVAIVKSDIDLSFGKDPQSTCAGDPVEVFAGAIHLFRIAKQRVLASTSGKALALRTAEAMVAAKQFSPAAAESFLALLPEVFVDDSAGQAVALRVSTRIDERRRVARHEQMTRLVTRQAELAKLCKASVAGATAQLTTFNKRMRVMRDKELQKRRAEYQKTTQHISFLQTELRVVVDGLQKLGAKPEVESARAALAACKQP